MIARVQRAEGVRYQLYVKEGGRKVYVGTYDSRRAAKEAEEDRPKSEPCREGNLVIFPRRILFRVIAVRWFREFAWRFLETLRS